MLGVACGVYVSLVIVLSGCSGVKAQAGGDGDGNLLAAAGVTLERFMRARIERDAAVAVELLTDELREPTAVPPNLLQLSNPCWYRYEVLELSRAMAQDFVTARVRVYTHWWGGDSAGGVPRSSEEEIDLGETVAGWRIGRLSPPLKEVEEPEELHRPTVSACSVGRTRSTRGRVP